MDDVSLDLTLITMIKYIYNGFDAIIVKSWSIPQQNFEDGPQTINSKYKAVAGLIYNI